MILILIQILIYSCQKKVEVTPEEATNARRAVVAWLECEECGDGELEAVLEHRNIVIPSLTASLNEGPSPATLQSFKSQLVKNYRNIQDYSKTHPDAKIKMNEEDYVQLYTKNYIAKYQVRSAIALAKIGGNDAKDALNKALKMNFRKDVQQTIKESLEMIK